VIEGALYRRDLTFLCVDIDYGYVKGAMFNAREAGVDSLIDFVVMDSRRPAIKNGACDHAAFNPPFGIRIEPIEGITMLYDALFRTLRDLLCDRSSFITITIRKSLVRRLANDYGFRIINERVVNQGGIWSTIFLITKD
jgi:tRNA (guanine6-N2)-methyltransferase